MKLLTHVRDGVERAAVVVEGRVFDLPKAARLIDLIAEPEQLEQVVKVSVVGSGTPVEGIFATAPLWPVAVRMFDAVQLDTSAPVMSFGNPWSICGPNDDVAVAPGSAHFDVGVRLGAVIGQPGRNLTEEEAIDHIFGYVLVNDWSARDLDRSDTATTVGPVLVTPDELPDELALDASAIVNGHHVVHGTFAEMAWSFASLVSFASRGTTLGTGDLLAGEPIGGTRGRTPLAVGDIVNVTAGVLGEQACVIGEPEELHEISPRVVRQTIAAAS